MEMVESTGSFRPVDDLQSPFNKSRKSHRELHDIVFHNGITSTPSGNPIEASRELHDMVFPNGITSTPSGNPIEASPTSNIQETYERRRMTMSSRSSPRPSSVISLPATPRPQRLVSDGESRLSRAFEGMSDLIEADEKSPSQRVPTAHRPQRSQGEPLRSSVFQRATPNRSSSMALPSSPAEQRVKLDRSRSSSGVSTPSRQKRDSLVCQRVKAFSGAPEAGHRPGLSMDALANFPMPPAPNAPKRLDRSRYPFGS